MPDSARNTRDFRRFAARRGPCSAYSAISHPRRARFSCISQPAFFSLRTKAGETGSAMCETGLRRLNQSSTCHR